MKKDTKSRWQKGKDEPILGWGTRFWVAVLIGILAYMMIGGFNMPADIRVALAVLAFCLGLFLAEWVVRYLFSPPLWPW